MTSSPSLYGKAFRKALRSGAVPENLIKNLRQVVDRRGDRALWARIVPCVSLEIVRHQGGRWVVVETAHALTDMQRKKIKEVFSKKDYVEERIRPELVSGLRVLVDGEREFDGSLKRKLDLLL